MAESTSNYDSNIQSSKRPPHILLGITGSVASIKGPELALSLAQTLNAKVIVVLTRGGTNFWYKAKEYNESKWNEYCDFMKKNRHGGTANRRDEDVSYEKTVFQMLNETQLPCDNDNFPGDISICNAQDEWNEWNKIGDPVLHTQLRDWSDMLVIAPLSAHTLAKISNGLCDDTLSCIIRAWDYGHHNNASLSSSSSSLENKTITTLQCNSSNEVGDESKKPIIVAPAMNTAMWEHPCTKVQLQMMNSFWYQNEEIGSSKKDKSSQTYIIDPQVKTLACGDTGKGALANVSDIVQTAKRLI